MNQLFSPAPATPSDAPYEYQAWPAWWFGPNGQRQIFNSAEEVPEGWVDSPEKVGSIDEGAVEPPRQLTDEQAEKSIADLVADYEAKDLVAMLEEMSALDDSIEFSDKWPKAKLAAAIVENGGPLNKDD